MLSALHRDISAEEVRAARERAANPRADCSGEWWSFPSAQLRTSTRALADLCARFPLEVTAQKRDDWFRTTGRTGRWDIPDWQRVAAHDAGVHLTVSGYLTAAGTAIPVDSTTASVIAGWNPDETYWLHDDVAPPRGKAPSGTAPSDPSQGGAPTSSIVVWMSSDDGDDAWARVDPA